ATTNYNYNYYTSPSPSTTPSATQEPTSSTTTSTTGRTEATSPVTPEPKASDAQDPDAAAADTTVLDDAKTPLAAPTGTSDGPSTTAIILAALGLLVIAALAGGLAHLYFRNRKLAEEIQMRQ
ncbi:MAG: hypothetical protein LBH64_00410, partial [Coriobacteriales bacterium]|nr:hypothetical protein [Coriobacteriales bacterium]